MKRPAHTICTLSIHMRCKLTIKTTLKWEVKRNENDTQRKISKTINEFHSLQLNVQPTKKKKHRKCVWNSLNNTYEKCEKLYVNVMALQVAASHLFARWLMDFLWILIDFHEMPNNFGWTYVLATKTNRTPSMEQMLGNRNAKLFKTVRL